MKQLNRSKYINWLVNFIIVTLAVSPAFALGEGNRNLLLIFTMALSPLLFLKYPIFVPKIDLPLISLGFLMVCLPLVFHPETLRWPTVLYSCMFLIYFMAYVRVLINSSFGIDHFIVLLRWLLYAYCVVLIIQQICVLLGLPIFNLSNYSILEPWKLNSLMSEPSHSARVIPVLMYLYVCCQKIKTDSIQSLKENFREDKLVWFTFLWPTFTIGSTTAILFLIIVIAQFVSIRKLISSLFLLLSVGVFLGLNLDNYTIKRAIKVVSATLTLDEKSIIRADHSASFRIVPTIQGAKAVGLFSAEAWVGHGVDADQKMIKPLPTVKNGNAGAFFIWFNFGVIVAFIFWLFSFNICFIRNDLVSILVWFLCIWMYGGLNNQIIWLTLVLLFTFKFVSLKSNKYGTYSSVDKLT